MSSKKKIIRTDANTFRLEKTFIQISQDHTQKVILSFVRSDLRSLYSQSDDLKIQEYQKLIEINLFRQ